MKPHIRPSLTHDQIHFFLALFRVALAVSILLAATGSASAVFAETPADSAADQQARRRLVAEQLIARGIRNPGVLAAMGSIPRHWFVPPELAKMAYADRPLPIGEGQTISQPYVVALMTELLAPEKSQRVLEIGTGSGYQAAVLAALAGEVFTMEIKSVLYERARRLLQQVNFTNIVPRHGDGYYGWEEKAPFDGIMITASVDHIPPPLVAQLAEGGKLVLPLGNPFGYQNLVEVTKQDGNVRLRQITGVLFVPMTGRAQAGSQQ